MNRQEKVEEVSDIRGLLSGAQLVVLTEYAGLDVASMVALRNGLREANGGYRVMKNTLAKLATAESEFEGLHVHFKGPIGVAFTREDPATAAKKLVEFRKDHPAFKLKAGVLTGGKVLDADGLEALSKLPSLDQLRGRLVGVLSGVPRNFVGLLAAVPRNFVGVLEARRREQAGE
jgi:large subunit ribosomal protein L10